MWAWYNTPPSSLALGVVSAKRQDWEWEKEEKKYHLIICIPNRSEQEIDSVEFLINIFLLYKTGRHGINCVAIKNNTIFSIANYHPLVCVAAVADAAARSFSSEWVVNRLFCSNTCTYLFQSHSSHRFFSLFSCWLENYVSWFEFHYESL